MPADTTQLEMHCLCGACRFELDGPHNWVGHCHCESCRRATASPMTTWIGHPNGQWRSTGATPAEYESSPGTKRGFCPTCGSPLFFRATRYPEEMHFYAALLTDPNAVTPQRHYHADERLSWLLLADGLPGQ